MVATALAVTGALAAAVGATLAHAGSIDPGTSFYIDPNSQVMKWVAANPNDSRTALIRNRVASQPQAHWLSNYNPSTVSSEVSTYVNGAGSQTAVLAVYEIPNRDCGGASAGGAPDLTAYQNWVSLFAGALGSHRVIVILETDSLALQTCLSSADAQARDNALATAARTIKQADPNAKVYLDGGHSAWHSAADQAALLNAAQIKTSADGFFTNVSNFNTTAQEIAYGQAILSALGNPPNLHQIIDTSRNGNGSNGQWCDPSGRALGQNPTANTGQASVDAFLWVKPPGEADGCAATAGQFVPDLAYQLAVNAGGVTDPPPSSPPPSSPPPSSPPPAGGCHVAYTVQNDWGTGFTTTVTITNNGAPLTGWTLGFTFAGNQRVSSGWSATWTQSGAAVSAASMSYNGALGTGASATIGFQATYSGSNPAPTSFTLNSAACT
ncbi:MAG: glycoside hydrolase family 6 protein [Mycobacteriales bacterium]